MALMQFTTVEASAPGKLVIAGEYAVLSGAPALVLAVDARAKCRIETCDTGGWQFATRPPLWDANYRLEDLFNGNVRLPHPAGLVPLLLRGSNRLLADAKVSLDTESFFCNGRKIGIGSSAAVTVAIAGALEELVGVEVAQVKLRDAHARAFGSGSGLDVATSYLGGFVRYEDGVARNVSCPSELHFGFVFTGSSSSTASMVAKFKMWRAANQDCVIDDLCAAATATANSLDNAGEFLGNLTKFIQQLWILDQSACIGIWGEQHKVCKNIAESLKILYKPCGAGGGDTGMAVTADAALLERFMAQVQCEGLFPLNFKKDQHGIRVEHS